MAGRTGSPRSRVPVLAAEPVRTTSCGNRVFTDVIKSRVSRRDDPGLRGQVPNPVASVLIGHGGGYPEKRGRQGRLSRGHEARNCELGAGRGRKDPPRGCPALPCDTPILVSGLWNLVTAPWKMTTMHRDTSKLKTGLLRYETRSVCKPTPHLRNASRSATQAASDGADADERLTRGQRRRRPRPPPRLALRDSGLPVLRWKSPRVSGENGVEEMPRDGEIWVVHSSPADPRFVGSRSLVAPRCPLWGGGGELD